MRAITLIFLWLVSFAYMTIVCWLIARVIESGVGGPLEFLRALVTGGEGASSLLFAIMMLASFQVLFIAPLVGRFRLQPTGRSLRASVIGGAGLAAILTLVMVLGLVQLPILLFDDLQSPRTPKWILESLFPTGTTSILSLVPLSIAWLSLGAIWTAVLWKAGRSRDPDDVGRMARRLLAGTAIELVLSIPLYILARRRMNCYCALGHFWGIVIGIAGLFWLCGPWAVLLVTRSDRRGWARGVCRNCGYPKRADSTICSECGSPL